MPSPLHKLHSWYERFERPLSSFSLIGGFIFDALTLTRVDRFMENFWVAMHLLLVAMGIIILNIYEKKERQSDDKVRFWLIIAIQFAFGGLFSTFLVFYFRSATLAASWPFLALLALVFILNEAFKKHYTRLFFQISVLFVAIFAFAIYLLPVLFHEISTRVFIASGVVSLVTIGLFILLVSYISRDKFRKTRWILISSIVIIYAGINLLYFYNFIPPLPLSLKDAGVYHSITKVNGAYQVTYESRTEAETVLDFLRSYEVLHLAPNDPVYIYSAIFSPANFGLDLVDQWEYKDPTTNAWTESDRVVIPIVGGRDGGYRTYSEKSSLAPGMWRVKIETTRGQEIGRISFDVVLVASDTPVETQIK